MRPCAVRSHPLLDGRAPTLDPACNFVRVIQRNVVDISAGKWRLSGTWFRPLQPEDRAMFQAQVDRTHAQFKAAVTANTKIDDQYLQGQVFDGDQAVEIGLADGLVDCIGDLID